MAVPLPIHSEEAAACSSISRPRGLNQEQEQIFKYITTTNKFSPIFVTGAAGTGKSRLLRELVLALPNTDCLAYTNIAARNINGSTLHKYFKLTQKMEFTRDFDLPINLFIDEISMVPGSFLDRLDEKLRNKYLAKSELPFGGINLVVFGDFYQLPPISDDGTKDYPFMARVWKEFSIFELKCNMRQSEEEFISNLNQLRVGNKECLEFFNNLVVKKTPSLDEAIKMTNLVATKREAQDINRHFYRHLRCNNSHEDQTQYVSKTEQLGRYHYKQIPKGKAIYPYDQIAQIFHHGMVFCVGTRIMCTANAGVQLFYCNGDIGTITKIEMKEKEIFVTMRREYDGRDVLIGSVDFFFKDIPPVMGAPIINVRGLPFTYGWACTIHKAQGMTLKNLIVIPNAVFMEAQSYVALSRVTHSEGLRLLDRIPPNMVLEMPLVDQLYTNMKRVTF